MFISEGSHHIGFSFSELRSVLVRNWNGSLHLKLSIKRGCLLNMSALSVTNVQTLTHNAGEYNFFDYQVS